MGPTCAIIVAMATLAIVLLLSLSTSAREPFFATIGFTRTHASQQVNTYQGESTSPASGNSNYSYKYPLLHFESRPATDTPHTVTGDVMVENAGDISVTTKEGATKSTRSIDADVEATQTNIDSTSAAVSVMKQEYNTLLDSIHTVASARHNSTSITWSS